MAPRAKPRNLTLPVVETSPQTSSGLLTPAELAARLRVAESWVREKTRERARLRDRDPLPVVRLGKYVRFSWAAVEAWLARQSSERGIGLLPVRRYSTVQVAKMCGFGQAYLQRLIAKRAVPFPPLVTAGALKIRLWSDRDVARLRKTLAERRRHRRKA